ncbi:hypothetical protein AU468_00645 [Alkalispirochaeta sphaeroplastigenens]|uniref:Uncharacterized protein n=1 Tax=Alkalispirochaeta sphaeroplastigenens TaxID=1187066 RepID=A0A2S4K0X5_9SPIO|nr:hypothetical protein [Alkalispirochaeta sphaeroplastigenens]POR05417.1 hypothetical protein AU468_00645 [Alkalispirochaeta sphaeroplastigenens]
MDIYRFLTDLAVRRLLLGTILALAGAGSLLAAPPAGRGAGTVLAAGGAVLLLSGICAGLRARRGARGYPDEYRAIARTLGLRRSLGLALRLELLLLLAGAVTAPLAEGDSFLRGAALGAATTAGILLLFDGIHRRRLPSHPPAWYDPAV